MMPEIYVDLEKVLEKLREAKPSRENSLAITKIEEAMMWFMRGLR
jgi:hypothetical protein